jgi:5'-3' exonuclease
MKISGLIFAALLFLFVSCKSKTPKAIAEAATPKTERFEKVALENILLFKKNRAYDLGKRLLETCNTSRFKSFTRAEATDKVIKNATVDKITKTCQKMLHRNGKFIDLNLIDITHDNETDGFIFRYEIKYEKKYFKRELSVTIDNEDKVSAITSKEIPKTTQ